MRDGITSNENNKIIKKHKKVHGSSYPSRSLRKGIFGTDYFI
jgi:hypothetical protein